MLRCEKYSTNRIKKSAPRYGAVEFDLFMPFENEVCYVEVEGMTTNRRAPKFLSVLKEQSNLYFQSQCVKTYTTNYKYITKNLISKFYLTFF